MEAEQPACPHGFGDDVVCVQCHPDKLPGFQNGEGMDADAWEEVPTDDEGYPLVECEACRCMTLDDDTDVCRNPACPTQDIIAEAIAMCEADAKAACDEETEQSEDTKRLDWLDSVGFSLYPMFDPSARWVMQDETLAYVDRTPKLIYGMSIREVIDAAMATARTTHEAD